MKEIAVPQS